MVKYVLTAQKEKLLREDLEQYLMGQIQMIKIAEKREVSVYVVGRILRQMIAERMNIGYIPPHE